jgi:hypothetical protein
MDEPQTVNLGNGIAKMPKREQSSEETKDIVLAFNTASE